MTRKERNIQKFTSTTYLSDDGKEFIVKEYRGYNDVTIEFIESGFCKDTSMYYVVNNKVSSPFKNLYHPGYAIPLVFEDNNKKLIGRMYNIDGTIFEVIGIVKNNIVKYKIHDQFGYEGEANINDLRNKKVGNPYKLNTCGCYHGLPVKFENADPEYNLMVLGKWHALCSRATGKNFLYNYKNKNCRLYTKFSRMCKQWMCYHDFAIWYDNNYKLLNPEVKYHVDKDLLYPFYKNQTGIYKLYSPATSLLLPDQINTILFDPAETRSEITRLKILELAEYYKSINALPELAYHAIQIIYNGAPNDILIDATPYLEFAPRLDSNMEPFYPINNQ